MQITKIVFAMVAALMIAAPTAQAAVLLEPYVGYHTGSYKWQGAGQEEVDMKGMSYGARLGYSSAIGFMVGADFMKGAWQDSDTPKADIDLTDLGIFVGYDFPVMVRVYGVYGLSSKATASYTGGETDIDGTSLKLGVGFTVLPLVSVNLEYYTSTLETDTSPAAEMDVAMYGLSVSLPFEF